MSNIPNTNRLFAIPRAERVEAYMREHNVGEMQAVNAVRQLDVIRDRMRRDPRHLDRLRAETRNQFA